MCILYHCADDLSIIFSEKSRKSIFEDKFVKMPLYKQRVIKKPLTMGEVASRSDDGEGL